MKINRWLMAASVTLGGVVLFQACGSDSEDPDTSTGGGSVAWADVSPIIVKSCVGGDDGCHNNTSANTFNWEDATASTFASGTNDRTRFKARLESGDMPPAGSGYTLSSADKKTLESYFD